MRLLYVAGTGRSGSTLLGRLLGQAPGCASVGELVRVWQRGVRRGLPCSCGRPFAICPYWQAVGREAFGGWQGVPGRRTVALQRSVDRVRYVAAAAVPLLGGPARRRQERYLALLAQLYRGVQAATGAEVVVDTSKRLSTLLLLRRLAGVDLRIVHLVRDSRGVAYSWTKPTPKPELAVRLAGRRELAARPGRRPEPANSAIRMDRYPPPATALRYLADNLAVALVAARGVPTCRVRYEDLIEHPRRVLRDVLAFADVEPGPLPFVDDGVAHLDPTHSLGGNPGRFAHGALPLRRDDEWQARLPAVQRTVVTALTAPLLAAYGYPLRRRSRGRRGVR